MKNQKDFGHQLNIPKNEELAIIELCKDSLIQLGGATNALKIIGADEVLQGLDRVEKNRLNTLKAIDLYLKQ